MNTYTFMQTIPDNIKQLIDRKNEGAWWDFKERHHSTKSDLIHDALCFANSMSYCDKYLIIGIHNDGSCIGVHNEDKKSQADIINIFDSVDFANRQPNLTLSYYDFQGKIIGVLTIKDEPYKPYYLAKESKGGSFGRPIPSGSIYTRTACRNTPIDSNAKDYDIEKMWKERLGIREHSRVIFDNKAYAGVYYTIAGSLLAFETLNLTFRDEETSALITTTLDIEALHGENELLLLIGENTVKFEYEIQHSQVVHSMFRYSLCFRPSLRPLKLERITGVPK